MNWPAIFDGIAITASILAILINLITLGGRRR